MRPNLVITTGVYTGNGSDNTNITDGSDYPPMLAIIKREASNAVMRTRTMKGDSSAFVNGSLANAANYIQALRHNGFQVGSASQVNSTNAKYYYLTIWASSNCDYFKTFNYEGNGADSRNMIANVGLNKNPDFVLIKSGNTTTTAVFRTSDMPGDLTLETGAIAGGANIIQELANNGFQLGTNTKVNGTNTKYNGFSLKNFAGAVKTGKFTGTGSALSVTGLGFRPDIVILKSATSNQLRILTTQMVSDGATSMYIGTATTDADGITSLGSDGFSVGTSAGVNTNGTESYYLALKAGQYQTPFTRN